MLRNSVYAAIVLTVVMSAVRQSEGEQGLDDAVSALQAVNDIDWSQRTVKVVDPEGRSIENAIVSPFLLGSQVVSGHWTDRDDVAPRPSETDANGEAIIAFPKFTPWTEKSLVTEFSIFIAHPSFCTKSVAVAISDAEPVNASIVTLERGYKLRIAGVSPGAQQPLTNCHVLLEGAESDTSEFTADIDGWLQSIPIRKDRRWFRVVRTEPGQPPEFSSPQSWTPQDVEQIEIRAEIRPGVLVRGVVSDSVSRPVEQGYVVAWCSSPVHQNEGPQRPIWWIETVPIQKDGTFEFPSLPSGYIAQLYALANDSISSQPTTEAYRICCQWFSEFNPVRPTIRYGQVLRLAGKKQDLVLEMELAGQARVKCIDENGRPLAGINVSSSPNQYMVGGLSAVFCSQTSTLDRLTGRESESPRDSLFSAVTGSNGEAIIRNLPEGKQWFFARSEHWRCKANVKANVTVAETELVTLEFERAP